jgi:ubiquinone/menaquinone biosynthesis C-methylase UbiE
METPSLFRDKAADYAKYRADYPDVVIRSALESVAIKEDDVVADLGAGTGLLSRWFLERGNRVLAVEPERGMREVAEVSLRGFGDRHTSVEGTAERTTLPDASVTLIVVGNAFHYFDPIAARAEVARILRPGGRVLILGHDSAAEPNEFMRAYLDFIAAAAPDKVKAFHQTDRVSKALQTFFGESAFHERDMGDHGFRLTWEGLRGRFLSTSVAPAEDDVRREDVLARLAEVFRRFEQGGTVPFQLRWRYLWSRLEAG